MELNRKTVGLAAFAAVVFVAAIVIFVTVKPFGFGKMTPSHGFGGSTAQVVLSDDRVPGDQGASRFKYAFGEEESEVNKI